MVPIKKGDLFYAQREKGISLLEFISHETVGYAKKSLYKEHGTDVWSWEDREQKIFPFVYEGTREDFLHGSSYIYLGNRIENPEIMKTFFILFGDTQNEV